MILDTVETGGACEYITSAVEIQYMATIKRKTKQPSGKYVTIYLDRTLYGQFRREASARKSTVGKIIKERLLEKENARLSLYDRVIDLIGQVDGPPDLSTNPKYLHGFGEDQ